MHISTLEALRQAEANLLDPGQDWNFDRWNQCTCGHIFTAAVGRQADARDVVDGSNVVGPADLALNPIYSETIIEVAAALGWDGKPSDWAVAYYIKGDMSAKYSGMDARAFTASAYVSDFTDDRTGDESPRRSDGLAVIQEAIAKLEAHEEQARLDVLAQARAVIDAAPVEEQAHA